MNAAEGRIGISVFLLTFCRQAFFLGVVRLRVMGFPLAVVLLDDPVAAVAMTQAGIFDGFDDGFVYASDNDLMSRSTMAASARLFLTEGKTRTYP